MRGESSEQGRSQPLVAKLTLQDPSKAPIERHALRHGKRLDENREHRVSTAFPNGAYKQTIDMPHDAIGGEESKVTFHSRQAGPRIWTAVIILAISPVSPLRFNFLPDNSPENRTTSRVRLLGVC